jgi:hypothetical protein
MATKTNGGKRVKRPEGAIIVEGSNKSIKKFLGAFKSSKHALSERKAQGTFGNHNLLSRRRRRM